MLIEVVEPLANVRAGAKEHPALGSLSSCLPVVDDPMSPASLMERM